MADARTIKVRLVVGNLVGEDWANEIASYHDPILEIDEGHLYIYEPGHANTSSIPFPTARSVKATD